MNYSKDMVERIGEELLRRRDICVRDDAPLTRDEMLAMLQGVYAVMCCTADNLSEAYRWLEQYEHELL